MAIDPKININENQVVFRRDGGHNHDGITSSLIDYKRYSIFDFVPSPIASPGSSRRIFQDRNVLSFKSFIVSAVEERVLNPQGIRIQANAITAREIVAGTISANELSSNIVLVNNIIRSSNFVGNLSGWAIYSNGNAEFNNVKIRGELLTGAGVYAASNTPLFANATGFFSLGNKITWDGSNLVINGTVTLSGTNIGTFDNGDALTGGSIGGLSITPTYIGSTDFNGTGQGFRIYSNGFADFNEVHVQGEIVATSGDIGGVLIGSSSISTTGFNGTSEGFALYSNGFANFREINIGDDAKIGDRLEIGGNLVIGDLVRINNPTADGGITTLKVRGGRTANSNIANTTYPLRVQNNDPSNVFWVTNAGNGEFTGTVRASGSILTSDERLKENIENLNFGLDFIKTIKPVSFNMIKDNSPSPKNKYGFIAQQVLESISSFDSNSGLVDTGDTVDAYYGLSYNDLLAPMVKAIQELSERIEKIENEGYNR